MHNMAVLPKHDMYSNASSRHDEFSAVIEALNHASGFELYRLQAAIDRLLDQPKWTHAIRQHVQPGQQVHYFSIHSNSVQQGKVIELRRKHVVVHNDAEAKTWLIPYAAINLNGVDGMDAQLHDVSHAGMGPHSLQLGEKVGFLDKHQQQRSGLIIRLNTKTATLVSDGQHWRVSYSLLHRIVEN